MTYTEWLSLAALVGIIATGAVEVRLARRAVARLKLHEEAWHALGCPERPGLWLRSWERAGQHGALHDPELTRILACRRRLETTTLVVGLLVLGILQLMK